MLVLSAGPTVPEVRMGLTPADAGADPFAAGTAVLKRSSAKVLTYNVKAAKDASRSPVTGTDGHAATAALNVR